MSSCILTFPTRRTDRSDATACGSEHRCDVVIFPGIRIERLEPAANFDEGRKVHARHRSAPPHRTADQDR